MTSLFANRILWVSLLSFALGACADERGDHKKNPRVVKAAQQWKGIFGDIDFLDDEIFKYMVYVHPKDNSKYKDIGDLRLSRDIEENHEKWIKEFFVGEFYSLVKNQKAASYYLNRSSSEPSLLRFEFSLRNLRISMIENANVIFISISKENGVAGTDSQITNGDAIAILEKWVNVPMDFHFTDSNGVGEIFLRRRNISILRNRDWRSHVRGFLSSRGLCIILMKIEDIPGDVGYKYDFDWLNKGLLESDGKTLVDKRVKLDHGRPRGTRLRSELPFRATTMVW